MNNRPDALTKYLSGYAEPESADAANLCAGIDRRYALVIPAFKERFDFVTALAGHPDAANTLLVVVVNEPEGQRQNRENRAFLNEFNKQGVLLNAGAHSHLYSVGPLLCLLITRLDEHAIPAKQGVGLARKMGADAATYLIKNGCIQTPWIFCSDADATLPSNYFTVLETLPSKLNSEQCSAIVFNFTHTTADDGPVSKATAIYEQQIKYYRDQLERAGSPYAFYTLGSCLACSANYYAQVRGFPKKAGAEDFYLLNKLAKLGKIHFAKDRLVTLAARLSDRVPFGTGPAVQRISEQLNHREHQAAEHASRLPYYNPAIFDQLKWLLESVDGFWLEEATTWAKTASPVKEALIQAGFEDFLAKRRQQDKSTAQFRQSFNIWFDAFQTLKFVRRLEENGFPPTPLFNPPS